MMEDDQNPPEYQAVAELLDLVIVEREIQMDNEGIL